MIAARRLLAACALAALLAGCTQPTASTVTVPGATLTVYASVPPGAAGSPRAQDLLAAERLALSQAGPRVGSFTVRMLTLNGRRVSDNARTAIQDKSAVAYLGELTPGSSADSVGITNAQDLLQVSPTDTDAALTDPTAAVPTAPSKYYEALKTYGRTFARMVPSTALEAKALVAEMGSAHVKSVYVLDDGSDYGKTLAQEVKNDSSGAVPVVTSQSGAGAILYATANEALAARLFNQAVASNPTVKLFGPSALDDQAFASALSTAAGRSVVVSAPGFLPRSLPSSGRQFVASFTAAYRHAPDPQAIFGYEAMASVLAILRQAGSAAGNRTTVIRDYFSIKNRTSVLGTYSINANGNTDLAPFIFSRVTGGRLVPYKFLQEQG